MTTQKRGNGKVVRPPDQYRGANQEREELAVHHVQGVVLKELRWLFRDQRLPDYGVDAQVEIIDADERIDGLLGLQIRGGDSRFVRQKGDSGWTFSDNSNHLDYWLRYALPVLVVIVDSDDNAFWEIVTAETVNETAKGFTMLIPRSQPFDATAGEKLLKPAKRGQRLTDLLPSFLATLPPGACIPLNRAEVTDRLAAARARA